HGSQVTQELFRREALEAQRTTWLGGVSLAQPVRLWVMTIGAALAALAVVLFLALATYTRRSSVQGRLVPSQGLAILVAPATGVVASVTIPGSGLVHAGERLVVVAVPRATLASGDTVAALEQRLRERRASLESAQVAQERMFAAQQHGLEAQLDAARRELEQIEAEAATRSERAAISRRSLDRLRTLRDGQYVSEVQLGEQEAEVLDQVGTLQAMQRQAIGVRRNIAQLQQGLRELPGQRQAAQAGYRRDIAVLEQELVETEARG